MKNAVKLSAYVFTALVFSVLNHGAYGQVTWQGFGGGSNDSGSWEASPSGWSTGGYPGPSDPVVLPDVTSGTRTITVDGNETIGSLDLEQDTVGPSNILTITNGNNLNLNFQTGINPITVGTAAGANPPVMNVGAYASLTFTGQDAGNATTPVTLDGTVNLMTGSTVLLSYTNPQGNAVFNIAPTGNVIQDGATLDLDYGSAGGFNNGTRQFINNGNWTLQNNAIVTMTQQGIGPVQDGFGNLAGNVNSGTMSVNSGSQVLFNDLTNNGTLNLGTSAAIGGLAPGWASTLTNASGGVINVTGTGAVFMAGTQDQGGGVLNYVGQAGSQLNVPSGTSLTFAYQNNGASLSNSGTITQNGGTITLFWNITNYNNTNSGFSNAGAWTLENGAVFQSTTLSPKLTGLPQGGLYWGGFGAGANNTNVSGGTLSVLSGSSLLIGNLTNAGTLVLGTNATMGSSSPSVTYQNLTLDNSPGGVLNVTGSGVNLVGAPSASVNLINEAGATMNFSSSSSLTMNYFTQQTAMFSNSGTVNQAAGSAVVLNWNETNYNVVTSGFSNAGTWTLQNGAVIESTMNGALYYGGFNAGANNTNVSGGTLSVLSGSSLLIGNLTNAGTLVLGTNATMGSNSQAVQYQALTLDNSGTLNVTGSGVNLFANQAQVQVTNEAGATTNFSDSSSLTINFSTGRTAMFSNSGTVNQADGSALVLNWNGVRNGTVTSGFSNAGTWTLQNGASIQSTNNGELYYGGFNAGVANTNASGGTLSVLGGSSLLIGNLTNAGTLVLGTNATMGSTDPGVQYQSLTLDNSGTLNVTGSGVNLFANQGQVQVINEAGATMNFSNGSSLTLNATNGQLATISNSGQVNLGGSSTMVLNNGSGTFTQTAGVLDMGTSAALSAGTVQINGGTLLADGPGATISASLVYDSPAASTYQGVLAGAGNSLLVNNPAAMLVLSGSNTYLGGTTVESGTLVVNNSGAIMGGASLTVGAGGTFIFDPSVSGAVVAAAAAGVTAVPEPGTLALLAVALVVMTGAWRKRVVPR